MPRPQFFGSAPTIASSTLRVARVRHLPGNVRACRAVVVSEPLTRFYRFFPVEAVAALGNKVVETLRTQDPTEGTPARIHLWLKDDVMSRDACDIRARARLCLCFSPVDADQ